MDDTAKKAEEAIRKARDALTGESGVEKKIELPEQVVDSLEGLNDFLKRRPAS